MTATFSEVFGRAPEAVARAPGRVNLLGEHTDYNDGFVLPLALHQQTTVSLGRADGEVCTLHSADLCRSVRFGLDQRPDELFGRYVFGCLHEAGRAGQAVPALDIHVSSEVPIGVGLSSSAALEVATLRALDLLLGSGFGAVAIAQMAQRAEIEYAGVQCGIMDQMAASLGDEDHALFLDTRSLRTKQVELPAGSAVLVLDSGVPRSLAASPFNQRRRECAEACQRLGVGSLRDVDDPKLVESLPEPWRRRARHVVRENARVLQALAASSAAEFGALMDASHASLRDDFEVSVPQLDQLVALLQAHPAVYGARLTGAGFGGACVSLCAGAAIAAVSDSVLAAYHRLGQSGRELARCPQHGSPASAEGDRNVREGPEPS
ncbi:MAG: galactokinase [Pseudomonadota bacterium]|nr:galactokinase [Pseudomonadota bacterium]